MCVLWDHAWGERGLGAAAGVPDAVRLQLGSILACAKCLLLCTPSN